MIVLTEYLNGSDLKGMFISAAANLSNNKTILNELNVFPVPDGDTGTNMALTMGNAVTELASKEDSRIDLVSACISSALLRGARGNSGVILSLLFRGFARRLREIEFCTPVVFAEALQEGVDAAYKAVLRPTEGTILTVSRLAAKGAAEAAAREGATIESVLERALERARTTLEQTIEMNPVLKKAGVIDAGGKGYVYILEGMLAKLSGEEYLPIDTADTAEKENRKTIFDVFDTEDIKFTYCTELIIVRNDSGRDPDILKNLMEEIGDSAVIVADDEYIKIHVHSNNPGKILEEAVLYGALTLVKVDNMKEQHSQLTGIAPKSKPKPVEVKPAETEKTYGFVAVAVGEGICEVFRDLGIDQIVDGGQTMNPSTNDILSAINKVPADIVFVFPNNKNIIMAAEQVVPLLDKRVIVIPTASVAQGISAMIGFDPDATPEDNRDMMFEIMEGVHYGQITDAARDAVYDDRSIKKGDHICLADGKLVSSGREIKLVMKRLLRALKLKEASFVTVFYGNEYNEQDLANLMEMIHRDSGSLAEIKSVDGGQPVYSYIVSVE